MVWSPGWTLLQSLFPGGDCRAQGISGDGKVVVGQAWDATRDNSFAVYWTEAGIVNAGRLSPADGGDPDGDRAQFYAASHDGSVLVGESDGLDQGFWQAIKWTAAGGMQNITDPTAGFTEAQSVTADGGAIAGYTQVTRGVHESRRSFIWTQASGNFIVPLPAGAAPTDYADWCKISPNGQHLIGRLWSSSFTTGFFNWSASTGSVLGASPSDAGYANSPIIGDDGVSWSAGQSNVNQHAVLWRLSSITETTDLGLLPGGTYAYGLATNRDGSAVAGYADNANGDVVAILWTAATGMVGIPPLAGFYEPYPGEDEGLSTDGSTFAGYMVDGSGVEYPFVYRNPAVWHIRSNVHTPTNAGIGDLWMDERYIDFSDLAIRRQFINADKSWVYLGYSGEFPLGGDESPMVWNAVQPDTEPPDPQDFLYGYGQWDSATEWNVGTIGNDPTTNQPYPQDLSFDECAPPPLQWKITSKFAAPEEGGIGDLWMDQRYVDFSDPATRQKFINTDNLYVSLGHYGEKPFGTYPLVWNTVQTGHDPTDFIQGYGQNGTAPEWNVVATGNDPTTNQPYPDMSFDECVAIPPRPPEQPVVIVN